VLRRLTLLRGWERAGEGGSSPEVVAGHGEVVAVGLGSRRRRGERGVENGAALRDFGGALRHELELELELIQTQIAQKPMLQAEVYHEQPHVFQRYPGVPPGRPYVRLTNAVGPLSHKLARTPIGAAIFFARPMMLTSGARQILVRAPSARPPTKKAPQTGQKGTNKST
jgi:hypothetical protein